MVATFGRPDFIAKSKLYSQVKLIWLEFLYERSHASSFGHAVLASIASLSFRLKRLRRLGWARYVEIADLELAAAFAGLSYPDGTHGSSPPWRMPDRFLDIKTAELPIHPLIDAALLSGLGSKLLAGPDTAASSLRNLLVSNSLPDRWNDIPQLKNAQSLPKSDARIAVCLHLFYPDLWPTLFNSLKMIPEPWDLFISVPDFSCSRAFLKIVEDHSSVFFLPCANRGRDVLPFIHFLNAGAFNAYDIVLKIHSKRSLHISSGEQWLHQLLQSLMPSIEKTRLIIQMFDDNPMLGMAGPQSSLIDSNSGLHRGCNQRALTKIAMKLKSSEAHKNCPFFSGTMFWFRPKALDQLISLKLTTEHFPVEMRQTDGTLAHSIERYIWPIVEQNSYQVAII